MTKAVHIGRVASLDYACLTMSLKNTEEFSLVCADLLQMLTRGGRTTAIVSDTAGSLKECFEGAKIDDLTPEQLELMNAIVNAGTRFLEGYKKIAGGESKDQTWSTARKELLHLLPPFLKKNPPSDKRDSGKGKGGNRFVIRAVSEIDSVVVDSAAVPVRRIGCIEFSKSDTSCEALDPEGKSYGRFETAQDAKSEIVERYPDR